MMTEEKNTDWYLIEKKATTASPLDFDSLRARGIELAQAYSGDSWTDFNLHDPGLTILEYLCYALTDLAYRTNFPLEDILTANDGRIDKQKNFFFTAREILTTNPVSINDFRKLIIDRVPEIDNVWVEPVLSMNRMQYCKGLYKIFIRPGEEQQPGDGDEKRSPEKTGLENKIRENNIINKVRDCVNECRNFGEDFEDLILLKATEIKINANILISANQLPEEILSEIYTVLDRTLNPRIPFYSERELQQLGFSAEEINNGPVMQNGFIREDDLKERPKFIDPSDILKTIAGISGVALVQELSIEVKGKKYEREEHCPIANDDFLFFNAKKYSSDHELSIHLVHDNFRIPIKFSLFSSLLKMKLQQSKRTNLPGKDTGPEEIAGAPLAIKGSYRYLDVYSSIQYLFPEIYNLKISLDDGGTDKDVKQQTALARVKQLKAFLMLFEQVVANYLAQLSNIENIFSADMSGNNCYTYFSQPLYEVPGAEKIINAFNDGKKGHDAAEWNRFKKNTENHFNLFLRRKSETDSIFINRKNRVLDHLLSRFNFIYHHYPLQLYKELYNWDRIEGRVSSALQWKKELLDHIVPMLRNRNQAFNYAQKRGGLKLGGFQDMLLRMMYIGVAQHGGDLAAKDSIKRLSPAFGKITMSEPVKQSQVYGEGHLREHFVIHANGVDHKILKDTAAPGPGLTFKATGISFFREGLNMQHYRIVNDDAGSKQKLLIYKSPKQLYWSIVGRFADHDTALKARNEFVNDLRKMNLDSEGFHIVEHVLLKPHLQSAQFGFRIIDEKKHVQLMHNDWTTFEERDRHIAKLVDHMRTKAGPMHLDFENEFEGICKIAVDHDESPKHIIRPSLLRQADKEKKIDLQEIYARLDSSLADIAAQNSKGYFKIRPLVMLSNKHEVEEDFFNFRVTVVLPAWPARFRDMPFREFTQKLFIEHCPAHIRLRFLWLDINKMAAFEDHYFEWLAELNKDRSSTQIAELCDKLVDLLYEPSEYR